MRRGLARGAALLAVGLLAVVLTAGATARPSPNASGISAFADSSSERFARLLGASNYADFKAAALQPRGQVRVILQLEGASVAERTASAEKAGSALTEAQQGAIRAQLQERQAAVAAQVTALGGNVLLRFQDAYNGISAIVPAAKMDEVGQLAGVKRVQVARTFHLDNTASAQYVNVPAVWNGAGGFTGDGVTIAVLDTGIDYTHAMFGGAGTADAFDEADELDTVLGQDEFGDKIIGGFDFVGDDYDADSDDPAESTSGARPGSARLRRARLARRGHGGRLRRPAERHDVPRAVDVDDVRDDHLPGRARHGARVVDPRLPRVRLRRLLGRGRHRGRDQPGGRRRRRRDQHVARLGLRTPR